MQEKKWKKTEKKKQNKKQKKNWKKKNEKNCPKKKKSFSYNKFPTRFSILLNIVALQCNVELEEEHIIFNTEWLLN